MPHITFVDATSVDLTFVDTVDIDRSVEDVFDDVSDFTTAAEWRTEVLHSRMTPPAPIRVGTTLYEVARVNGRRVVTESIVDAVERPHRWTFAHVRGPLPVSGEYRFEPVAGGTRLTYTLRVGLPGLWRLAAPYLRWAGRRMMAASLASLRERLETPSRGSDLGASAVRAGTSAAGEH
jgi:uncharacterized protein YndB with AHSA1/START domain